jgi:hypothetical protein
MDRLFRGRRRYALYGRCLRDRWDSRLWCKTHLGHAENARTVGRFQIVHEKQAADLILLLSADPYNGGYIIFASGQTGTMDKDGHIEQDRVPNYNRQAPVRDAYLTVIDPTNGQNLWTDSHVWGGLLTGTNNAGARLIQKLRKQIGK